MGNRNEIQEEIYPVGQRKITIYLNRSLANLSHRLTVVVNGRQVFNGKVLENLSSMVNSCAAFGDPRRLYTAQIDVDIASPAAEKMMFCVRQCMFAGMRALFVSVLLHDEIPQNGEMTINV